MTLLIFQITRIRTGFIADPGDSNICIWILNIAYGNGDNTSIH
jgi:hypothetical protein